MIVNSRIQTFIQSLDNGNTEILDEIEQQALQEDIPIVKKDTQCLLKLLLSMQHPQKILEIGTAVGFSAVLMAEYSSPNCKITTIEKYEKRIPKAVSNIQKAGKSGQIHILEGEALEIMQSLTPSFDFIFMDAAKGQYINFLPEVLRLLSEGGVLVSDNILQDGDIIQSRYAVTRRNRTIHSRIRDYLYVLKHTEGLITDILPIGDGVAISVKRGKES